MKPEGEAGQIALKEERHRYILELLGSKVRGEDSALTAKQLQDVLVALFL